MKKPKFKIKFSRESRINNHDVDMYTLYVNGKPVYYAQYRSCVVDYVNEHYASLRLRRLKQKLSRLSNKDMKLRKEIGLVMKAMSNPLVEVEL